MDAAKMRVRAEFKSNQIFHYTRCITPKRVTSLWGPSPRYCACGRQTSFRRNVAPVASRWQHCVQFDRPEIWTSGLPLQRRTRYRSTNWTVRAELIIRMSGVTNMSLCLPQVFSLEIDGFTDLNTELKCCRSSFSSWKGGSVTSTPLHASLVALKKLYYWAIWAGSF